MILIQNISRCYETKRYHTLWQILSTSGQFDIESSLILNLPASKCRYAPLPEKLLISLADINLYLSLLKHRKELHKPSIQCNFCSKTFRSNVGFKVHVDKREEMLCDICGQCFCNNYDFKVHLRCHSKMKSFHNKMCLFKA